MVKRAVNYEVELHTGYDVLSKKHAEFNTALRQFDRIAALVSDKGPVNAARLWRMGSSSSNRCLLSTDRVGWASERQVLVEELS